MSGCAIFSLQTSPPHDILLPISRRCLEFTGGQADTFCSPGGHPRDDEDQCPANKPRQEKAAREHAGWKPPRGLREIRFRAFLLKAECGNAPLQLCRKKRFSPVTSFESGEKGRDEIPTIFLPLNLGGTTRQFAFVPCMPWVRRLFVEFVTSYWFSVRSEK